MTWLAFFFALEVGYLPMGFVATFYDATTPDYFVLVGSGYVDLDGEVQLFKYGFIGGGVKTYIYKYANEGIDFTPVTAEYDFRAGVRIKPLEIGFRHYCTHPVVPWVYYREISPQWEGAYEEIYLRVKASF